MIDHAFKPHEVWKDRDYCEHRIDSGDGSGMTSACCLPRRAHPTPEALRIAELEAALSDWQAVEAECGAVDCHCGCHVHAKDLAASQEAPNAAR